MNAKHITTIVFDLDGTLLDTLTDLHASVNHALALSGMPPRTRDDVRRALGNGYLYLISHCVPEGTPEETTRQVLAAFQDYYYSHSMDATAPYPGIPEVVSRLAAAGYKLAIVSNKGMAAVKELATHFFSGTISVAIGESEGVRRKPAPDTAIEAMRALGSTTGETLYVGDSEVDIATARNAGTACLSVAWGFRSREMLAESGATTIIDRPEEILTYLGAE